MVSVQTEKLKALQEHWDKYSCDHKDTDKEIRKRTIKGGATQYVYQCLHCGAAASNAISKEKAIEMNGGVEPFPFDVGLIERWNLEKKEGEKKIIDHFENVSEFNRAEFHKWYAEYLESEEWKLKKEKVFKRAKYVCEGCMEAKAEVVHHLTYENVGEEFLFELVALCRKCHDRYHANEEEEI